MSSIPKTDMPIESPRKLLDVVYKELGYQEGTLLKTSHLPSPELQKTDIWLEKGGWLSTAKTIGVERIFFVKNDPVIVFRAAPDSDDETLRNIFQEVWSMGRPQCLFIASPGELRLYSLNKTPAQTAEAWQSYEPLETIHSIVEISEKLHAYRREQVESGQLFVEENFGKLDERADKQLILDLKQVRKSLLAQEPKVKDDRHIHALIGRSIFVRYLEDRGILEPDYFQRVAEDSRHKNWSPKWLELLNTPDDRNLTTGAEHQRYIRVLRDKDFTYALFDQLAEHFNGDMFPRDPQERDAITQAHLDLLRGFLMGDTDPQNQKLFLWAYDFKIIPIELISSIYEEFYHKANDKDKGTHYTPGVLVDYVLSQVLTTQRLATRPKILDFACGSAIFLVQAFQRLVRYEETQLGRRRLKAKELRHILRTQITGIEIDEEAVHIAAFSLYLALLHYQEPKSILAQIKQTGEEKPLPHIIYDETRLADAKYYPVLFKANAFSLMPGEREHLRRELAENQDLLDKQIDDRQLLLDSTSSLPLEPNSFDIIVGNPPWGYLKKNEGTPELRLAQEHTLRWCRVFDWEPGDKEMSQAFIGRSLSFLKPGGECGLLVSAGVTLKRARKSVEFRQRWLSETKIKQITNFTHVRDVFFSDAISPFCFVHFEIGSPTTTDRLQYWSAKKIELVDKVQAVILNLPDLHQIRQLELLDNDLLWKVYWWGSHRDANFINLLKLEKPIHELANEQNWPEPRVGFQGPRSGVANKPRLWLGKYKQLDVKKFKRYGPINMADLFLPPKEVQTRGFPEIYEGWRLLIKQGLTQADEANGRIDARLENLSYSFQRSIYGINIDNTPDWQRKLLIAVIWSSLARYYFFMTGSSWGTWSHKIYLHEVMNFPIRFPEDVNLRQRIIDIVEQLQNWNPLERDLEHLDGLSPQEIEQQQKALEKQLDEAIFDLYELTEAERDLVLDTCETGLEFFYRAGDSAAVETVITPATSFGTIADLPGDRDQEQGLDGYLYGFLQMWNPELEAVEGEFQWHVIQSSRAPMLAVIFSTRYKEDTPTPDPTAKDIDWDEILERLKNSQLQPVNSRIYIDGMVRAVTETDIIIIKRNERRLWTRSLAREDAEATLLQAMMAQEIRQK